MDVRGDFDDRSKSWINEDILSNECSQIDSLLTIYSLQELNVLLA